MEKMPEYRVALVRELRARQTESEARLWQYLRAERLSGLKFRRQRPLGRYVADFCCDAAKLVVEIDGGVHDEAEQKEYDAVRDTELTAYGCKLLRVKVSDVTQRLPQTLDAIRQAAAASYPLPREGEGDASNASNRERENEKP